MGRVCLHIYLMLYVSSVWVIQASPLESKFENTTQWVPTGSGNQKIKGVTLGPEGRILAYVKYINEGYDLKIKYLKDKGEGISILKNESEIAAPVFSSDGKSVIFSMKKDGFSKIYRKDLRSNSEPKILTQGKSNDYHPSLSPDGRLLAFDSDRSGNFDIWLLDLETYQRRQLTRYKNHDFHPRFSPDGSSVLYTSYRNEFFNLFMKNLKIQASQPLQLTQEEAVQAHPVFSNDGSRIFFDSNMRGSNHIFSLNIENMKIQQVSQGDGKYSNPVESKGILVYMAEEYGVFGVKKQSSDQKAQSNWPHLQSKELQALSEVVNKLKQETKADFEKDLLKVRKQQETVIPTVEVSNLGAPFERAGFELGFLEEKKRKIVEKGILTNQSILDKSTDSDQNTKHQSLREQAGDFSQELLPEPRTLKSNLNSSPLQKLWDQASASIAIDKQHQNKVISEKMRLSDKEQIESVNDTLLNHYSPKMPNLVKATFPKAEAIDVPVYQPLGIVYNRELYRGEHNFLNARLYEGSNSTEVEVNSVYNKTLKRVDITPKLGLKEGTKYRVSIGNAVWSFTTAGKSTDNRSSSKKFEAKKGQLLVGSQNLELKIKKIFPRNRSRGNDANTPIQVEFNQKLDPASLHSGTLTIYQNGKLIPGEMVFEDNDRVLTLKPYRNLGEAQIYEVRLSPDLKSKYGKELSGNSNWKFKTRYFSPFLVSEFPPSILDKQDQSIEVKFNRELDSSSIRSDEYFLQGDNFRYNGRIEVSTDNRSFKFKPYQRIPNQQEFKFYLSPNLTDRDGNVVDNARPINLASRFLNRRNDSSELIQKARNYYPKSNSVENGEQDLLLLESFFAKGYIYDRKARNLSKMRSTSRYKIALLIEEAIENISKMRKQERRDLQILMQKYETELRNLGVDIKSVEQNLSRRDSIRYPRNNAFTARGRSL